MTPLAARLCLNTYGRRQQTIEDLGALIKRTMASKEDIKALQDRVSARFDGIESQLGKIENLLMEEQKRDIENLKARVKRLEDVLAV